MSGTACVTPAWPRQRSDAVGNGRGGEGKQQLVGKGGGRSLGGGRGAVAGVLIPSAMWRRGAASRSGGDGEGRAPSVG